MSRPDTANLKFFLKAKTRGSVSHPDLDGETVRVEDVTREYWSYRVNGELRTRSFSDMSEDQISRILGGGDE